MSTILENGDVRLTINEVAKRYRMGHRAVKKWFASGEAPGTIIPGSSRIFCLKSHCDLYDQNPTAFLAGRRNPGAPVVTSPYVRRIGY